MVAAVVEAVVEGTIEGASMTTMRVDVAVRPALSVVTYAMVSVAAVHVSIWSQLAVRCPGQGSKELPFIANARVRRTRGRGLRS